MIRHYNCWRACILAAATLAGSPQTSRADYATTINPQTTWGVWEGWGASLCWWANVFGQRNDLADIVFTTNYTTLNGIRLPGLGMNIARYNAGACSTNTINGESMQVSLNMIAFRQMPGYWLDWFSSDPGSASWDWTADANQRAMLLKAQARGANLFELFSNSPLWWMCYNHNPSGADNGSNDNLQWWNYQSHAAYLATIAHYAHDHWGINFDSVEPFNEPVATWWSSTGTQEGCHFDPGTQATVIGNLRAELDARNLTNVNVAASDENRYDEARATWGSFDATIKSQVGRVNVHGYQYESGKRDLLYSDVAGKRLWNSEYGEADASGISLAINLNLDFRWLHPTAWCYWQPFDSGGWGLVQSNPGDGWIGGPNPKYYVLAQYTRHIRPGMTIIDGGGENTVAAYDATARKLIIVTANYDTDQTITYNLTNFYQVAGPVRCWMTASGSGYFYTQRPDRFVTNKTFSAAFPTNAIQTFELRNVDLNPPPRLSINPAAAYNQCVLTWPTSALPYQLEGTASLGPSVLWQRSTNQPAVSNGYCQIVVSTTNPNYQFFRLNFP